MDHFTKPHLEFIAERPEKSWHRIPSLYLLILIIFYITVAYTVSNVQDIMPPVVPDNNVNIENPIFSEQSARKYLSSLVGDGPRVAGTKYHLEKTKDLKEMLFKISQEARVPVQVDWQIVSGDHFLTTFVSSYQNVSNVVALLKGTNNSSILFNCHYDSVPNALGASDNGMFCAVMLETLSRLSKRSLQSKHNIIFLFNGAEEYALQGSLGFLHHEWAKNIVAVVNLDSCGTNGKPSIFQVTDPRVLHAYSRATSRPSVQSMGEYVFASGLIPSDTDFRVWRDVGNIYGIDIAFTEWGQVYHTKNDRIEFIKPGVIQNAGEMLMGLAVELADMDEFRDGIEPTHTVYYDFLNMFMVSYSLGAALVVDMVIFLIGIMSVAFYIRIVGCRWSMVKDLIDAFLINLVPYISFLLLLLVGLIILLAMDNVLWPLQLRYLSQPWIVVPLFWMPLVSLTIMVSHYLDDKECGLNRSLRVHRSRTASILLLTFFLGILFIAPYKTASIRYFISVPLLFTSLGSIMSMLVTKIFRHSNAYERLLIEVIVTMPAFLFLVSLSIRFNAVILPIMGRTVSSNPDAIVGIMNTLEATIVLQHLSGIALLFCGKKIWRVIVPILVACLIISVSPIDPYTSPATQRQVWIHTSVVNVTRNETVDLQGLLILSQDVYNVRDALNALNKTETDEDVMKSFKWKCENQVYCGLTLWKPSVLTKMLENSAVVTSFKPPKPFPFRPTVKVIKREWYNQTCLMEFELIGSRYNIITLWPLEGVSLTSWSFESRLNKTFVLLERPVYVISHAVFTYSEQVAPFRFTLAFHVSNRNAWIVSISHHALRVEDPAESSSEYTELNANLRVPSHFSLQNFISHRFDYIFYLQSSMLKRTLDSEKNDCVFRDSISYNNNISLRHTAC